jgi:hypothetical protein|tara:strand:+ start:1381 stop:1551 length:171 start_codon:yes stop_codon:yes gene_type:complete
MNLEKKKEFEAFRKVWLEGFYEHYRLLDIDFEMFMLMKGMTKEEYKYLNDEELWQV